jgi:DnaJ-class molecular chaperone
MYLNPNQIEAVNKKRYVIEKHFLNGVRYCNHCGGTGLDKFALANDGSYIWDGVSFCDKCEGIGYLTWKETLLEKLCPTCQGTGVIGNNAKCPSCDKKGVVDWVRYIRLGGSKRVSKNKDKNKKPKNI